MNISEVNSKSRLHYLDGLRAIFCMIVIVDHFVYCFFPDAKVLIYNDGNLAVVYFFVLSGYLVVYASLKKNSVMKFSEIPLFFLKRYRRLFPVVFITICISGIVYFSGNIYTFRAAQTYNLMKSYNLTNAYMPSEIFSIKRLIYEGIIGAFVSRSYFNSPFWTIKYELWSVGVLWITTNLIKMKKNRGGIYVILCLLLCILYDFYVGCVFVGGILADAIYNKNENVRPVELVYDWMRSRKSSLPLIALAVISYVFFFVTQIVFAKIIVISVLMIELYKRDKIKRIFEHKLLLYIGEYSYEIYAVHNIILSSFSCWLMIQMKEINKIVSCIFVCIVTIILSIILGKSLNYFVELLKYRKK